MKRILCCLLALILLGALASAEEIRDTVRVQFEDGFALSLPSDWVSYEVAPELADSGFIYCLGSADGAQLMYIQRWNAGYAELNELESALASREEIELRTTADGNRFLMYNFADADCSGCVTLFNGSVLNLLVLPQTDSECMLTAAMIMESADLS